MDVAAERSYTMVHSRSLDDMDIPISAYAFADTQMSSGQFSRSQSQRGSRKSLGSLGSDEVLIKVGEIEHKDPFKSFANEGGGQTVVRKITRVTTLKRQKSSTSLNTDTEREMWSDEESEQSEEEQGDIMTDISKQMHSQISMQETLTRIATEETRTREEERVEATREQTMHVRETASPASSGELKRRLSSVNNPDYYNYAWRTIRKEKEDDDDDGTYWRVLQEKEITRTQTDYRDPEPPIQKPFETYEPMEPSEQSSVSDQGRRYGSHMEQMEEYNKLVNTMYEYNGTREVQGQDHSDSASQTSYERRSTLNTRTDHTVQQTETLERARVDQMVLTTTPAVREPSPPPIRRAPSVRSVTEIRMDISWRNPDLPEVIEYLHHHNEMVRVNAAAYLQHLSYTNEDVKLQTRVLGGIPLLVELVNSDIPDLHRAACGALKNISFGRMTLDNKIAIKNAGGVPTLIRLLRKTNDMDVQELITGILWNLSSVKDLKRPIIDDCLAVLVNVVIIPHSGWQVGQLVTTQKPTRDIYWSTVFRNTTGILRNVSSDGFYARTKMRECQGLVDSFVFIIQTAIGRNDIDNKCVENCVCLLRNLSYACQEVIDPDYATKLQNTKHKHKKTSKVGCFGAKSKKSKHTSEAEAKEQLKLANFTSPSANPEGQFLLWHPFIVTVYLPLLYDCTNPEALEAAAGAIQNLVACQWKPSDDIREAVRKQKGLPVLVELLNLESDKVVCSAATALRNLAVDPQSKDLIGKYAMRQLVQWLPQEGTRHTFPSQNDTLCALQGLIYEVIIKNTEFCTSLLKEGGVERMMYIVRNDRFDYRIRRNCSLILKAMWQCVELHTKYRESGWKDMDFLVQPIDPKSRSHSPSRHDNNRDVEHMNHDGPPPTKYDDQTISKQQLNNMGPAGHVNQSFRQSDAGSHSRLDNIPNGQPMTSLPHRMDSPEMRRFHGSGDLSQLSDQQRRGSNTRLDNIQDDQPMSSLHRNLDSPEVRRFHGSGDLSQMSDHQRRDDKIMDGDRYYSDNRLNYDHGRQTDGVHNINIHDADGRSSLNRYQGHTNQAFNVTPQHTPRGSNRDLSQRDNFGAGSEDYRQMPKMSDTIFQYGNRDSPRPDDHPHQPESRHSGSFRQSEGFIPSHGMMGSDLDLDRQSSGFQMRQSNMTRQADDLIQLDSYARDDYSSHRDNTGLGTFAPRSHEGSQEPLYARVVKNGRSNPAFTLDDATPNRGPDADSWV